LAIWESTDAIFNEKEKTDEEKSLPVVVKYSGIKWCRISWIETMDRSICYFASSPSLREPKYKVAQRR